MKKTLRTSQEISETFSSEKKLLLELESSGQYLFHGTPHDSIDMFEPRQSYNRINGVDTVDGEPAVFASTSVDYAIFMAIINKENCPHHAKGIVGPMKKDGLYFATSKATLEQLTDLSVGYVYVFDKTRFKQRENRYEFFSTEHVTAIQKIRVSKADVPQHIDIIAPSTPPRV